MRNARYFSIFTAPAGLAFALALLLATCPAVAQSFRGKIILGVNGSQINGDGVGGFNQAGLLAGAGAAYPLSERTAVEFQALYSMKGSRTSDAQSDSLGFFVARLNYLEFPLLLNYTFREQWVVSFGPAVNVLLAARYDDGFGFFDFRDSFRTLDYQGQVALEYRVWESLGFNLRFCHSLWPMNQRAFPGSVRADAYNFSLAISVKILLSSSE